MAALLVGDRCRFRDSVAGVRAGETGVVARQVNEHHYVVRPDRIGGGLASVDSRHLEYIRW